MNLIPHFPSKARATLLGLALVGSVVAVVPATNAQALPPTCDEFSCEPDPEPTVYTYESTLSVAPPTSGAITGTSGASPNAIDCRPGGVGTCSVTDTIETLSSRRPVGGWPSYTLHASGGPAGYAFRWDSSRCQPEGDCGVTNNRESAPDVVGHWADVQAPAITFLDVPAGAADDTPLRTAATDNDRVSAFHWKICSADDATCDREHIGPEDVYTLGKRAAGTWRVLVRAADPAGNWSPWTVTTTQYDTTPPALTMTAPQQDGLSARQIRTTFTTSDAGGSVSTSCAVDARAYVACTSPWNVEVGSYGTHTVHVVATDPAGNRTQVDRTFRVVALELHPETDFPPTYGKDWTVAYGSVPSDATGSFQVRDRASNALLCGGPAGPNATLSCRVPGTALVPGVHTIDVTYSGDARNPAARGSFTTTVQRPANPGTAFTISAPTTRYGTTHPLSASALPDPATGVVTFTAAGRVLCRSAVHAGRAACQATATVLPAGSYPVVASFTDPVWPAQQASTRMVITKGATRIAVRASKARLHRRTTLTATGLPATATGRIAFTSGRRTLCTAVVRGGVAKCSTTPNKSRKRVTVIAHYSGNPNWAPAAAGTRYRVGR